MDDRYEAIRKEAFERYVLDLMRSTSEEEERQWRANGRALEPQLWDFKLIKEFPETNIQMRYRYPREDREGVDSYVLWSQPEFFDAENGYKPLADAVYMSSMILMWARGG